MKLVGYFFKALSIFIFSILVLSSITTLKQIGEYKNEGIAFMLGYIFGILVLNLLIGWLALKLFQYSNRIIKQSK